MVEINNQRKAFLDMLAWSEGTDNGRQSPEISVDVIVGGELFTDYSDHPRKLVTLNPKLKSTGAGRYQLLSRWWDAYRKQLGLEHFSEKSGRCGIAADYERRCRRDYSGDSAVNDRCRHYLVNAARSVPVITVWLSKPSTAVTNSL